MRPVDIQDTAPEDHDTEVRRTVLTIRKEKNGNHTLWLGVQGWRWTGGKCMPMTDAICLGVCTDDNLDATLAVFRTAQIDHYIFQDN
jgi:hypothetical protein